MARCPKSSILEIESHFEPVFKIPLGNIDVEIVSHKDDGFRQILTLDAQGKGKIVAKPSHWYEIRINAAVTPQQIDELFDAYDGLSAQLEAWLRQQWAVFKP